MITILDGAMGTELTRRGVSTGRDLWSARALLEAPETVLEVHRDYIAAGADVITTNSYSTVPSYLSKAGEESRYRELTALAGELARRAADGAERQVEVAGSLPPLSESYRTDLVPAEADALPVYRNMTEALAPWVDHIVCETLSTGREARCAASAALEVLGSSEVPVFVSWTLDETPGAGLRNGESIAEALAQLDDLDVAVYHFNCTYPEAVEAGLAELRELTDKPIGAYPNRFSRVPEGWTLDGEVQIAGMRDRVDVESFVASALRCVELGATRIGGCCGIGPEFIAALANATRRQGAGG